MRLAHKREAVLRMRCHKCSNVFELYPSDNVLLESGLCPACYLELKHPVFDRWFRNVVGWAVMIAVGTVAGVVAWGVWVSR